MVVYTIFEIIDWSKVIFQMDSCSYRIQYQRYLSEALISQILTCIKRF